MVTTPRQGDSVGKQRRTLTERALHAAKNGAWEDALTANRDLLQLEADSAEAQNRLGKALSESVATARRMRPTRAPKRSSRTTRSPSGTSSV